MAGHHGYHNWPQGEETTFVTTTVIRRFPAFQSPAIRDEVARSLCDDHLFYGAVLHAFVVMPSHIHFLCTLPPHKDVAWFVQRVKSNAARLILPRLSDAVKARLGVPKPGREQVLWQKSFRSFPVFEAAFVQKVQYIHNNPVKDFLCGEPAEYRWSTALLFETATWSWETGWAAAWLDLAGLKPGGDPSRFSPSQSVRTPPRGRGGA